MGKAYGGRRRVVWFEVLADEKARDAVGEWLPADTIEAVKAYRIAIKGPLTTPVGGGIRSLNVTLRQVLDLYACVRPVRYYRGTPAPVTHPEKLDVVIFSDTLQFRALDIVKPWPARQLEALHGGWGIMADDLMAGIYANLLLRVALLALPLA